MSLDRKKQLLQGDVTERTNLEFRTTNVTGIETGDGFEKRGEIAIEQGGKHGFFV